MNFTLQKDDPKNDTILTEDGRPLYQLATERKLFHKLPTTVRRMDCNMEIAQIQPLRWGRANIYVRGKDMSTTKGDFLGRSETFVGSNGVAYKWKIGGLGNHPKLIKNDGSETPVAFYNPRNRLSLSGGPATLTVTPEGVPILDDIIATWSFAENRRRERRKHAADAASSAC